MLKPNNNLFGSLLQESSVETSKTIKPRKLSIQTLWGPGRDLSGIVFDVQCCLLFLLLLLLWKPSLPKKQQLFKGIVTWTCCFLMTRAQKTLTIVLSTTLCTLHSWLAISSCYVLGCFGFAALPVTIVNDCHRLLLLVMEWVQASPLSLACPVLNWFVSGSFSCSCCWWHPTVSSKCAPIYCKPTILK